MSYPEIPDLQTCTACGATFLYDGYDGECFDCIDEREYAEHEEHSAQGINRWQLCIYCDDEDDDYGPMEPGGTSVWIGGEPQ